MLLVAASLWIALAVLAPWAASRGWNAAPVYGFFGEICHQDPERSFRIAGLPSAACHRCVGLYLGGLLGLAAATLSPAVNRRARRAGRLLLVLAVPLAADWSLGALGVHDLAWTRFVTGVLAGLPAGLLLVLAADDLSTRRSVSSSAKGTVR